MINLGTTFNLLGGFKFLNYMYKILLKAKIHYMI